MSPLAHKQDTTPPVPRHPLPHIVATAWHVLGRNGKPRLVLLVGCPYCGSVHQHTAREDFTRGRRTSPCGQSYHVHAGTLRGAA